MVNWFTSLGYTRDDLKWTLGMIAAIIVGLAAVGDKITDYGIPGTWLPYLRLGALIVGIVSGYMATSPLFGKANLPKTAILLPLLLIAGVGLSACGSTRHIAVVADASFSSAVFAVDDAERQACNTGALTPAQCASADPKILHALQDVKAVTLAIQASPASLAIPQNLPDLISDLATVQNIVAPLHGNSGVGQLASKVDAALAQAAALLVKFTGGN